MFRSATDKILELIVVVVPLTVKLPVTVKLPGTVIELGKLNVIPPVLALAVI